VPSASPDVYQQLQPTLGAPSSTGAAVEAATNAEASWQLADGSSVLFSGPFHRVVLLGKDGASLAVDIRLRDLGEPNAVIAGAQDRLAPAPRSGSASPSL